MVEEALHPRDKELMALARAAGDRARTVAGFAVEAALRLVPVADELVSDGLAALSRLDMSRASTLRAQLRQLAERIEEPHWAEAGEHATDVAPADLAFSQARVVTALESALMDDPVAAAVDAIYEVQAAVSFEQGRQLVEEAKARLRDAARLTSL